MKDKIEQLLLIVVSGAVGSLGMWVLINWVPNVSIIVGGALSAYLMYNKTSK